MTTIEERAHEFGRTVREILKQAVQLHSMAAFAQSNLGHQDLRVVEQLGEVGPQMMRSLAEHLGVAVNSMTSLVDNLEQKGLAHRTRSDIDRRVIHVALTNEGERVYESTAHAKFQFHRALLAALSDEEQEILLVLFRKIEREGCTQVKNLPSAGNTRKVDEPHSGKPTPIHHETNPPQVPG